MALRHLQQQGVGRPLDARGLVQVYVDPLENRVIGIAQDVQQLSYLGGRETGLNVWTGDGTLVALWCTDTLMLYCTAGVDSSCYCCIP